MPFKVEVDDVKTLKQFDELAKNIKDLELEMSTAFLDWQRDDMNRKFPSIEGGGVSVSTMIYPRSRLTRRKSSGGGGGAKQARRRARVTAGRPGATRPILRPELLDQLKQRMADMMKEAIEWQ